MKQQKHFRWQRRGVLAMLGALIIPLFVGAFLSLSPRVSAQTVGNGAGNTGIQTRPLPAGKTCGEGTWSGDYQVCHVEDGPNNECPAGYTFNGGIFNDWCEKAPRDLLPGENNNNQEIDAADRPAATDDQVAAAKEGQAKCDDDFPGTIFDAAFNDPEAGNCKPPKTAADCQQATKNIGIEGTEYTFEKGTNTPGDPTTNDKCVKGDLDTCPIPKSGNGSTAMRWIACPVTEGLNYLILGCPAPVPLAPDGTTPGAEVAGTGDSANCTGGLNGLIRSFLYTDTNRIFGSATGTGDAKASDDATAAAYKASWGVFRTIAVGMVIIAGLVMIVSEALGLGVVDAYTIRKLLPRLLVVAIGVTLSWSLCAFLITFFNDLGAWAQDLITFPFQGLKAQEYNAGWILSQWFTLGGAGVGAVLGVQYLISISWMGILSLIMTIVLALLIAAAVLLIRQMVILLCVIVSPLAIACAVLPNTQKLFSLWFSTFMRTLIMYPVVIAFLSLGIVFSWIASQTPSLLNGFIAIFAFALPYFMLPYAFKLSGGAMATVANLAQERSKPFLDKQKEKRQEKRQHAMQEWQKGNVHGIGKNWNWYKRLGENVGAAGEGLRFGGRDENGRRTLWNRHAMDVARAGRAMKHGNDLYDSDEAKALLKNDDYARAATYASLSDAKSGLRADFQRQAIQARQANIEDGMDEATANAEFTKSMDGIDHRADTAAEMVEKHIGYSQATQIAGHRATAEAGTALDRGPAGAAAADLDNMAARVGRGTGRGEGSALLAGNIGAAGSGHAVTGGRHDGGLGAGRGKAGGEEALQGWITADQRADRMHSELEGRYTVQQLMGQGKPMAQEAYMSSVVAKHSEHLANGNYEAAAKEQRKMDEIIGNLQSANGSGRAMAERYNPMMQNIAGSHVAALQAQRSTHLANIKSARAAGDTAGVKAAQQALAANRGAMSAMQAQQKNSSNYIRSFRNPNEQATAAAAAGTP